MSQIKIITPGSQDFLEPVFQMVKLSSRGLIGIDRDDFIKRSSAEMAHKLDRYREKLSSGEVLAHLLAVGATEDYGANRNGDGFRRQICRDWHHTFEKLARFFRNHKNKDKAKSYGRVIKSAFHEPMKRIELLVALNGTEEAARCNGGLVADKELEKLAAGKDIPVSMACKVPYDVCSYCGNKAPAPEDYCVGDDAGGRCKAGGLRDNMGALVDIDGGLHQLHADNIDPCFFDISHVPRGADRIAYVTGMLEKTAAARGRMIKSAELARELGISLPYELMIDNTQTGDVQRMLKFAYQLADMEAEVADGQLPVSRTYLLALSPSSQVTEQPLSMPPLFREKFALALRALADARVCLPLQRFIEAVTDHSTEKAAEDAAIVSRELPGIFTRLVSDPNLSSRLGQSDYVASPCAAPPLLQQWASKQAADMALSPIPVSGRITRAALRTEAPGSLRQPSSHVKVASDRDPARRLAEEYALYKLGFLGSLPATDPDLPLTAALVLLQNYAS